MRRQILCLIVVVTCVCTGSPAQDQGMMAFDANINGQPVRLAFDTGAELTVLFERTAKRLGLEVAPPSADAQPAPGKVKVGFTQECQFQFAGHTWPMRFAVADLPGFLKPGVDGLIGWGSIKDNVIEIRHNPNKLVIRSELGIDPANWSCFPLRSESNLLIVQIPKSDGSPAEVLIDTGAASGVDLTQDRWKDAVHPQWPSTLSAVYIMGRGLLVLQESWAKELIFEGLRFTEIPVSQGITPKASVVAGKLDAVFGLYAISCFSWVIDGTTNKIYLKPNNVTRVPRKYHYNRLGAVFVPRDVQRTNALLAHVVESSPAYKAGIRPGDELLRINDIDATKWRTDRSVMPLSRFWDQPAGAKLNLEIQREGQTRQLTVTLEEIFGR